MDLCGALVWRGVVVGPEDDTNVHGALGDFWIARKRGMATWERGRQARSSDVQYPLLLLVCSIGTAVRLEELMGIEFDGKTTVGGGAWTSGGRSSRTRGSKWMGCSA